jgi:hypothetical protein
MTTAKQVVVSNDDSAPRHPREQAKKPERFDPYWCGKKVDSQEAFLQTARDRPGFHRGAKIRKPQST